MLVCSDLVEQRTVLRSGAAPPSPDPALSPQPNPGLYREHFIECHIIILFTALSLPSGMEGRQ